MNNRRILVASLEALLALENLTDIAFGRGDWANWLLLVAWTLLAAWEVFLYVRERGAGKHAAEGVQ